MLLVLLHDFPELLCEYHFALCDCVPPSCIQVRSTPNRVFCTCYQLNSSSDVSCICSLMQMRNLLLSAFPRAMRLPDPFTPNLKVNTWRTAFPECTSTVKHISM